MAIFTVVLAFVSGGTLWILNKQLGEMRSGGTDTHNLASAAAMQADRTKDLADRMKDQSDRTKVIADQGVIQAGSSQRLAQNAVDTLDNTQKAFRAKQRAWVGVQDAVSLDFGESTLWTATVRFFNSGRTPARNVKASVMYKTSRVAITGPSPRRH